MFLKEFAFQKRPLTGNEVAENTSSLITFLSDLLSFQATLTLVPNHVRHNQNIFGEIQFIFHRHSQQRKGNHHVVVDEKKNSGLSQIITVLYKSYRLYAQVSFALISVQQRSKHQWSLGQMMFCSVVQRITKQERKISFTNKNFAAFRIVKRHYRTLSNMWLN